MWSLSAIEDGRAPQRMGEFPGGNRGESTSRRLAAARVVTAIGNWAQKGQPMLARKPVEAEKSTRWQELGSSPGNAGTERTDLRHHG